MIEPITISEEIMPGIFSGHKQTGERVIMIESKQPEPMSACGDSAQNVACDDTCPECIYKPKPEPMSARVDQKVEIERIKIVTKFIQSNGMISAASIIETNLLHIARAREEDAATIKEMRDCLQWYV